MSSTMSTPWRSTSIRRPLTSSTGALVTSIAARLDAGRRARKAVADETRPDREERDRKHGHDDAPGLDGKRLPVLVDHQTPVGGRRLQTEAEEAQPGDQSGRIRQSQARLDHQGAGHVGEDLPEEDLAPRLPDRLRCTYE